MREATLNGENLGQGQMRSPCVSTEPSCHATQSLEAHRHALGLPASTSDENLTREREAALRAADASDGAVERFAVLRSAVEREEHTANILRLRKAVWSGVVLWPLYFVMDYLMSTYVDRVNFASYASIRAIAWLSLAIAALVLTYARHLSRRALLCLDILAYGGTSTAVALMCVLHGGLASPYAAGIPVISTVRAAFMATPWRVGLWPLGISAASYPVVVLGAALLDGQLATVLANRAELAIFALYNSLILTMFVATLVGGHAVWALRRQVFETRNIGRYRLLRPLARGGMGEVWVAHDTNVRRLVALKILRTDPLSDLALRRFEREVEATSELTHPHTIRVFDYGVTDDGLWYYAMELLEGEDLACAVARQGPLAAERCVHLMLQVCGALSEAHSRGIVHRDIKPGNVFLCRLSETSDFVKVLDFGIAKRAPSAALTQLTMVDRVLGTPAYVSPEVATGGAADARSDVYGLGGLLYFLLTGTAPFAGNQTALLIAHAVEQPVPPSARLGAQIDPALEAIVMRCLHKNPENRYTHAGELLTALAQCRSAQPATD